MIFAAEFGVIGAAIRMNARASGSGGGNVAFATTRWSMVLAAQGESPEADEALEKLCRAYWLPIYSFVRRQGYSTEEAEDLTQAFFARFLERRDFDAVRRERGRVRSYLLAALKNFLASDWHRSARIKRGEGQPPIPLDELLAHRCAEAEPSDRLTAEIVYERRWASTLLGHVLSRLATEYSAAGNERLFDHLKCLFSDEADRPSQADVAQELGMTENAVKQAFHRFRQRYRAVLCEEIANTVANPTDVEDELRHLIAVLRA